MRTSNLRLVMALSLLLHPGDFAFANAGSLSQIIFDKIDVPGNTLSEAELQSWRAAFSSLIDSSFLGGSTPESLPRVKIRIEVVERLEKSVNSFDFRRSTITVSTNLKNFEELKAAEKQALLRTFAHEFGHALFHNYVLHAIPELKDFFEESAKNRARLAEIGRLIAAPQNDMGLDGNKLQQELQELTKKIQSSKKLDIYLSFHEFMADVIGVLLIRDLDANVFRPISDMDGKVRSFRSHSSQEIQEWQEGLNIFNSWAGSERHYGFALTRWKLGPYFEELLRSEPAEKLKVLNSIMEVTTRNIRAQYQNFATWRAANPAKPDMDFLRALDIVEINKNLAQDIVSESVFKNLYRGHYCKFVFSN